MFLKVIRMRFDALQYHLPLYQFLIDLFIHVVHIFCAGNIVPLNEAFQRKLDHQMSLHANVPKVFCAVVSNVAQAIGIARGF